MQQFLLYSHCVFASWLLLPCNKLKQYLGALLLLFSIHCYLQESRDVFPHTELFLQLLLLENSPSCNSCLSHVLNPHYFTNVIGMSHSLTVLLLNLGWVFFWIPAHGGCFRKEQMTTFLVHWISCGGEFVSLKL